MVIGDIDPFAIVNLGVSVLLLIVATLAILLPYRTERYASSKDKLEPSKETPKVYPPYKDKLASGVQSKVTLDRRGYRSLKDKVVNWSNLCEVSAMDNCAQKVILNTL